MDADFIARITYIAQRARSDGFDDVSSWMQRMLAANIREDRPRRKRGIKVVLGRINRRVELDEARVKQLMENGE